MNKALRQIIARYWVFLLLLVTAEGGANYALHYVLERLDVSIYSLRYWVAIFLGSAWILHYVKLLEERYGGEAKYQRIVGLLRQAREQELNWGDLLPAFNLMLRYGSDRSIAWSSIEECLLRLFERHSQFPADLIHKLPNNLSANDAQQVCKWFALISKLGLSPTLIENIEQILRDLMIPKQVEGIFGSALRELAEKMALLAEERPIPKVDRSTQYSYAGGVATYYKEKTEAVNIFTVFATSLDTPSVFWGNHQRYFEQQAPLPNFDEPRFLTFADDERNNLERIDRLLTKGEPVTPYRNKNVPPAKSRIVLITQETLTHEFTKPPFWDFVKWHIQHHFGLKFLILNHYEPNWYQDSLSKSTGETKAATIDDFIVYGEECVYGRVDPIKDTEGEVMLGFRYKPPMHAGKSVMAKYKSFFESLWLYEEHSLTLSELWYEIKGVVESPLSRQRLDEVLVEYRRDLRLRKR